MSEQNFSFNIACNDPGALANRITKAPYRLITDIDELRASGYQDEGVIVPLLDERESLSSAELAALAVPLTTPDALRIVRVPQRTYAFMEALDRSKEEFSSCLGKITAATLMSLKEAPASLVTATINPTIGRYVGLHIDALKRGDEVDQNMMGVVCGPGARGITVAPAINVGLVHEGLRRALSPEDRLARREYIRNEAAKLQGSAVCYTIWLEGSGPTDETYEAYANLRPRTLLHDGTTYLSDQPGALQMIDTQLILPKSFDSLV